ncbi:leucine-rich repeat domain-containing protein [Bifidobacterium sp. ESL0704]|uniref:leucine-rich repeat domain-containing protein n=1 Tax=Bifidobacterium sp. ESL0704 TaxID=2983219 RepID=UPI0023F8DF1F|nr:leucine-rich repeat domain-containing protein [Bifidobacterium sp. ESL0704]WEV52861.1 leucine-rich repeat domain-containing protein [Bifidobacterium sp. ESL0704]
MQGNSSAPAAQQSEHPAKQTTPSKQTTTQNVSKQADSQQTATPENAPQAGNCAIGQSTIAQCFPDPNLAKAIAAQEKARTTSTFTQYMVDHTTKLDLKGKSISSIEGLQLFTNLGHGIKPKAQTIVRGGSTGDINPAATELDLSGNDLTDVSSLAGLTNLQTLNLSNNRISDIAPLAGLTNLTLLGLSHNQLIDRPLDNGFNNNDSANRLDPLAHLTKLESLDLSFNKLTAMPFVDNSNHFISAFAPLSHLPLNRLNLSHNQINEPGTESSTDSNANPFSSMRNLGYLDLSQNRIGRIEFLNALGGSEGNPPLYYLNLNHNRLQDEPNDNWAPAVLAPLTHLTNLSELGLGFNRTYDLSPLAKLTDLHELNLTGTQSEDLTALAGLTQLNQLYLGTGDLTNNHRSNYINPNTPGGFYWGSVYDDGTWDGFNSCSNTGDCTSFQSQPLSDITPLKNLTNLGTLYLNNSAVTDLTALAGLNGLCQLDLSSDLQNGENVGKLVDVTPLGTLNNLGDLNLYGNHITDITALSHLQNLRNIDASYNEIRTLPSLEKMGSAYTDFYFAYNQINHIATPSTTVRSLGSLNLAHNQIRDITPLAQYSGFRILDLSLNQISNVEGLARPKISDELRLNNNRIFDISPMPSNIGIRTLRLANNHIRDIAALRAMPNLTFVSLANNQISDITPLASTKQLTSLDLTSNVVHDITPLKGLTELHDLKLSSNCISDTTPLAGLSKVGLVDLENQKISLPDAVATATMTLESAKGPDGTHLQPTTITPASGVYDATTGLVSWTQLDGVKSIGLEFSQMIPVGNFASTFSGTISQKIDNSGNGNSGSTTPSTHTVTFDSTGGSAINQETINDGGKATEPNKPTRDGFVFDCWQIKINGKLVDYDFSKPVTGDITLYAKWTRTYTVTFDTDGGTSIDPQTIVSGKNATAPKEPTRNGYLFQKWQIDQDGKLVDYDFNTPVTGNITLHALWTKLQGCVIDHTSIAECFPDRRLAGAVAKAQGNRAITVASTFTQTMIDKTTALSFIGDPDHHIGIKDLTGLDRLVNLTHLNLDTNLITDITSVGNLHKLAWLNLSNNRISDITPIGNLHKLAWLNLSRNRISDISPLANLGTGNSAARTLARRATALTLGTQSPAMPSLPIIGSQADEEPQLGELNLADNEIVDATALSGLTSLTTLDLSGNQISDISPLSDLQNLTKLNIANNKVTDISPLSGLSKLTSLNIDDNQIENVKPLAALNGLTNLSLSGNHIDDTKPLTGLSGLTTFDLKNQSLSVTVESLSPATIDLPTMNRVDSANATCAPTGCSVSVAAMQKSSGYRAVVNYPKNIKEGTLSFDETGALGSATGVISGIITLKLSKSGEADGSKPTQPGTGQPGQQPQKPESHPSAPDRHNDGTHSQQDKGHAAQGIASTGSTVAAMAIAAATLFVAGLSLTIVRHRYTPRHKPMTLGR